MLIDTLKQINNSSVFSKKSLARELKTSEEMVEVLINQLLQMGYLKKEVQGFKCSGNCSGCSISCKEQNLGETFIITDKGKKLLQ
ncbi:FeoC-like transcriptional regulator [Anaerosalibacter sp. Marseille-P3206]|uniref:FeoC-like transcriptional regulator n=1 Tax=Anaerosalibacter sp. Marseille-P3206 TaxID=1871005 RepID=UPI000985EF72|nr:FeoC-like transcriptional regulator [Anaerosalibacter sp. Marseille-P3206]